MKNHPGLTLGAEHQLPDEEGSAEDGLSEAVQPVNKDKDALLHCLH